MSKQLEIKISIRNNTYTFFGDTFSCKEKIKAAGSAMWNSKEKAWVVKNPVIEKNALIEEFPQAHIIEIDGNDPETTLKLNETPQKFKSESTIAAAMHVDSSLEKNASSVSSLLFSIRSVIQGTYLQPILVYGVLSSVKKLSSGRIYFDLIDDKENASMRCVLWENNSGIINAIESRGIKIEDDTPVMIKARVSFNVKSGSISLSVEGFVAEYTLGKIQASREKTNQQLKEEGVFYNNKKLEMPFLPLKLGLITSDAGTVINDFMASLAVSKFGFTLYWYKTRVQGEYAERDVCSGIDYFNKMKNVDAILIFRGGGSVTELSVFNNYNLVKKACMSHIPILSAIGHEYDQCSLQDVSNISFGVPKDIGRFFSDLILERQNTLRELSKSIVDLSRDKLQSESRLLGKISYSIIKSSNELLDHKITLVKNYTHLVSKKCVILVESKIAKLVDLTNIFKRLINKNIDYNYNILINRYLQIRNATNLVLEKSKMSLVRYAQLVKIARGQLDFISQKYSLLVSHISSHAPEVQLQRGYSILRSKDKGAILTKMDMVVKEDTVVAQLIDGEVELEVKSYNKGAAA